MTDGPAAAPPTRRAGGYALFFGLLAAAFTPVPVVGDVVSVPIAVLAVVCGMVGVGHYDAGRTPRMLPSLVGAVLGGLSLLVTAATLLAASSPS